MKIGNKGNNTKQINKQAEYKIGMNNKQYVNGFLRKVLCNMYTTMQLLSYVLPSNSICWQMALA